MATKIRSVFDITVFYVALVTVGCQAARDYRGSDFTLVFPDLNWKAEKNPPKSVIIIDVPQHPINQQKQDVTVRADLASLAADYEQHIQTGQVVTINVGQTPHGTDYLTDSTEGKAVSVNINGSVATCRVRLGDVEQQYLCLPNENLGTFYQFTSPPLEVIRARFNVTHTLAIGAPSESTAVTLSYILPNGTEMQDNMNNVYNFNLSEGAAVQINPNYRPFSGLIIRSSHPVSVLCGVEITSEDNSSADARMLAALMPKTSWGKRFILAPPAAENTEVHLDIIGRTKCSLKEYNLTSDEYTTHAITVTDHVYHSFSCTPALCPVVYLSCLEPVSVTQYVFPIGDMSKAGMIDLTPIERYTHRYRLRVGSADSIKGTLQIILVTSDDLDQNGFKIKMGTGTEKTLQGSGDSNTKWKALNAEGTAETTSLVWKSVTKFRFTRIKLTGSDTIYRLSHSNEGNDKRFGLFAYDKMDDTILSIPVEVRLEPIFMNCNSSANDTASDCNDSDNSDGIDNGNDNNEGEGNGQGHTDSSKMTDNTKATHKTYIMTTIQQESESDPDSSTTATTTATTTVKNKMKTPKPAIPADMMQAIIICSSVLIGVPLFIILLLALQAWYLAYTDNRKSSALPKGTKTSPEVIPIPIMTVANTPGPPKYNEVERESSC